MIYILAIIYVILCIPVAIVGTGTRLGFFGTLLVSILITPLIMIFLMITLRPPRRWEAKIQKRRNKRRKSIR